ncbi:hypothetical protein ABZ319_23315 [Nocardia sp. NPDC005978]
MVEPGDVVVRGAVVVFCVDELTTGFGVAGRLLPPHPVTSSDTATAAGSA